MLGKIISVKVKCEVCEMENICTSLVKLEDKIILGLMKLSPKSFLTYDPSTVKECLRKNSVCVCVRERERERDFKKDF